MIFLAKLLYLRVVSSTTSSTDGRLVAAVDRPLSKLPILLILLMIHILLFHSDVVLLMHKRRLVPIQIIYAILRWVRFLVRINCRWRVVVSTLVYWVHGAAQLS